MSKPSRTVGETPYHLLSAREKRARVNGRLHEPPVTCAACEAHVAVGDMVRHLETTCTGKPREHHLDQWIAWADVKARGISKATLHDWVKSGRVQVRGEKGAREYRVRDLDILQSRAAANGSGDRTQEGNGDG